MAIWWGCCAAAAAPTLYVATNGNDQWSGLLPAPNASQSDGPFATLERARDQLRALKALAPLTEGATVYVRGGVYYRTNTFELDVRDAGLSNAPLSYRAYSNETPILSGARPITNFWPWSGAILQANVGAQGFRTSFRQLFFNSHRQQLARFPNFVESDPYKSGWSYVDGALTDMYVDLPNDSKSCFRYKPGDVRGWARPQEAEVCIFPRYNWYNNILPVATIDMAQRLITLASEASYAVRPGDRYFVRNVFEELDAPGEWYLDKQSWTLYFWPPCGLATPTAYAPVVGHLVILGTANVSLQGLSLECAEATAIGLHGATNCTVAACTIRNVGESGIAVFGSGNTVAGNDIYLVGSEGIHVEGGIQNTLTPGANVVDNNHIHHIGVFDKGAAGISVWGVGNRASHNLIHDGPYSGVALGGNLNVVESNVIHHVNLETDDAAAIYSSGVDWITTRGNIIRYNYIYDSQGFGFNSGQYGPPYFAWGIYLDSNGAGVDIIGNIVADCSRGAIMFNNGRDNLVANNLLLNGHREQVTCMGWRSTDASWQQFLPGMMAAYDAVSAQPVWQALRGMNVSPAAAPFPDGLIMASNQFRLNILVYTNAAAALYGLSGVPLYANSWNSNIIYHCGQSPRVAINDQSLSFSGWQALGQDANSLVADPLFINAAAGDYRLQADSPALALGFRPLPLDQIGLYQSPWRASWPAGETLGAHVEQLSLRGTDVVVRIGSLVGHGYQLQRSETLTAAEWRLVGLPQDGTGEVLTFTEPSGVRASAGFYRVLVCP